MKYSYALNINNQSINSQNCLELKTIHCFNKHISTLCKKAINQFYVIGRIQKYMGFKQKEVLLNSFVLSNFNYCPLTWHFCSVKSLMKIEKMQERAFRILYNDSTSDSTGDLLVIIIYF